jgi:hypothetical protein
VERAQLSEILHTYASKATGIDSDTTESCAILNQLPLQSGASSNHNVQQGFRDVDHFKRELLKLSEVKHLDGELSKASARSPRRWYRVRSRRQEMGNGVEEGQKLSEQPHHHPLPRCRPPWRKKVEASSSTSHHSSSSPASSPCLPNQAPLLRSEAVVRDTSICCCCTAGVR